MNPFQWISSAFGSYDAVTDKGRRRAPKLRNLHEDQHLGRKDRQSLTATARDVCRNFAIARWAVQKHLDFVASFSFQAKTGDMQLDEQLEGFMRGWSSRHRCDIARRHRFDRMIRLAEARREIDGDFAFLKITAQPDSVLRGKLQAIEGDRIDTPNDLPEPWDAADFTNGVMTLVGGAATHYCICDRGDAGRKTFSRVVPADQVLHFGVFDRFDQVRGISPLASALNTLQDVYEGFDYALAKLKVAQMFGLVTKRADDAPLGEVTTTETAGGAESSAVDFGRGPFQLDLDVDDSAEFLESRTPPAETVEFLKLMTHVALKALDIPYSFFDESFTNFYGSRGGLIQYLKSCKSKRDDCKELLDDITRWRLGLAVMDGEITLPAGMEFSSLAWEWVPDGIPWWDPEKEVRGNTAAIAAGLSHYQRVAQEAGTDFFDNILRRSEEEAFAREHGVTLSLSGVAVGSSGSTASDDGNSDEGESDE